MLHTRPLISSTHIIHWFNCTCTLNGVALILLHPQFKKTPLPLLYHRIANNLCRHERSALPQSPAPVCEAALFIRLHKAIAQLAQHPPYATNRPNLLLKHFRWIFCVSAHQHLCMFAEWSVIFAHQFCFLFFKVHHRTDFTNKNIRTQTYTHTHTLTYSLAPIHNTILLKTTTATLK